MNEISLLQVTDCLTSIKGINKTDVTTLLTKFKVGVSCFLSLLPIYDVSLNQKYTLIWQISTRFLVSLCHIQLICYYICMMYW